MHRESAGRQPSKPCSTEGRTTQAKEQLEGRGGDRNPIRPRRLASEERAGQKGKRTNLSATVAQPIENMALSASNDVEKTVEEGMDPDAAAGRKIIYTEAPRIGKNNFPDLGKTPKYPALSGKVENPPTRKTPFSSQLDRRGPLRLISPVSRKQPHWGAPVPGNPLSFGTAAAHCGSLVLCFAGPWWF